MKFIPYDYQKRAIDKIIDRPFVGLFLEMGLGKTVISLTAAWILMFERFEVARVLVIAPLKVAEDTWSRESEKWNHLQNLKISKILGTAKTRKAAADAEADVYVINRENVTWLMEHYLKAWKWDMVIIDELSSFKSNQAERFKAFKKIRPLARRVVGLTGTPNPNGLMDLWAEVYCLDQGERLGKTIGSYRRAYFKPGRTNGYVVYDYIPFPGAQDAITKKISDITVSMKAEDYITLPKRIDNTIRVALPEKARKQYKKLEREHVLELFDEDRTISAASAAAVMGKLLQLSGGAVYEDDGGYVEFHDEKLKALADIIDTASEPVLVFYGYRHERERLLERFKKLEPREITGSEDITAWNEGRVNLLIAHPASVGYGLNLQEGGHIVVWYSLPWSLELYQQANARLYRQGQTKPVIINHLIATGTADENVMASLA
ncbi:MAG: DEAD/DEAH box helicase family protein, partial [Lachnospiraceae bacterium]|nr:DEAD/DEAH box helicase family protein [Lachnospiraceae bacterium]